MKLKFFALLLAGVVLVSMPVFASGGPKSVQPTGEELKALREQMSENAAFIRKVNSDPTMTPEQKKMAIREFIQAQNKKQK